MDFSKLNDFDIRDLALFIKRRCFSTNCKDCKLKGKDGRCFFDSQAIIYEGERPDGEVYKSIELLHPCHWDFDGVNDKEK